MKNGRRAIFVQNLGFFWIDLDFLSKKNGNFRMNCLVDKKYF